MNERLRLPVLIALCVLFLFLVVPIITVIQEATGIPNWSIFHPYIILFMFYFAFISRFGPERFNKRFYERLWSLTRRDQVIFGVGIVVFIVLGLVEPYILKDLSYGQGFVLQITNLLIWLGFTKLLGSQELNNFFWDAKHENGH